MRRSSGGTARVWPTQAASRDDAGMPALVPPIDDERELLLAYIDHMRQGIRYAAFGLTDDQARLTPTASALSIGGIVKHLTAVEHAWTGYVLSRPREQRPDQWGAMFTLL